MPITAVIGVHWGDEGKGKVVDYLVEKGYNAVARFNGTHNSGHTIYSNGKKVILHVIPSGILYPHVTNIIGNGVAIDPQLFLDEMSDVRSVGRGISNLYISDRCKVITPYHKEAERQSPRAKKIGTTGRGAGPVFSSYTARISPVMSDFFASPNELTGLLEELDAELGISERLAASGQPRINASKVAESYRRMLGEIEGRVRDTVYMVNEMLRSGSRIVAEGAQATLLDIDHGTYPDVTSSNTTAAGVPIGLGVPANEITEVVGVMKAGYITRVGSGAFPTELGVEGGEKTEEKIDANNERFASLKIGVAEGVASEREIGQYLRIVGDEYGATTRRPRRTGWPDALATEYSDMLNNFDWLALTKLDVTDFVPEIPISTGYIDGGSIVGEFKPLGLRNFLPCYGVVLPGWMSDTTHAREFDDLPENARRLVEYWSKIAKVKIVSNGPKRDQTIMRF